MDRTLIICKPDAVERGLVGEIIGRFERKGLKLAAAELRVLDKETLARHYEQHQGKAFYDDLVEFMSRGPALVAVIGGVPDTWRVVRQMVGATDPLQAAPGTVRGDLGSELTENLIHGSDSAESAEREIGIFFPDLRQTDQP
ncbi:MAG: nucleoside-diphosphate kinase [Acidimicrobiaceae bacterium]|nr:nucleoside-diphosphate kinase [Acidimicrobiaceae bacterium]